MIFVRSKITRHEIMNTKSHDTAHGSRDVNIDIKCYALTRNRQSLSPFKRNTSAFRGGWVVGSL